MYQCANACARERAITLAGDSIVDRTVSRLKRGPEQTTTTTTTRQLLASKCLSVAGIINNKTAAKHNSGDNINTTIATMSNKYSSTRMLGSMSEEEFARRCDEVLAEQHRQRNRQQANPPRPIAAANPNIATIPYEADEIDDSQDTSSKKQNTQSKK